MAFDGTVKSSYAIDPEGVVPEGVINSEDVNSELNPIYVGSESESEGEGLCEAWDEEPVTFFKSGEFVRGGVLYDAYGLPVVEMANRGVEDRTVQAAARVEDVDGAGAAVDADRAGSSDAGSARAATVEANPGPCDEACWCGAKLGPSEEECDEAVHEVLSGIHGDLDPGEIHDMAEGMFCPDCFNPDPGTVLVCGNERCDAFLCLKCCEDADKPRCRAALWTCCADCEDTVLDRELHEKRPPTGAGNKFFDLLAAEATGWGNQYTDAGPDVPEASEASGDECREQWDDFIEEDRTSGALCLLGESSALRRAVAQAKALQEGGVDEWSSAQRGVQRKRRLFRPSRWSSDEDTDEEGDGRPQKKGRG